MPTQQSKVKNNFAGNLASYARRRSYKKGEVIFKENEERTYAFIIEKGTVSIKDENDKTLAKLGAGEIFGEMALIEEGPRTANAIASTQCELFLISRDTLFDKMNNVDPLISLLISMLVERYRMTRIHLPESIKQESPEDLIDIMREREKETNSSPVKDILTSQKIALNELKTEQELRQAIERREFSSFFQPIIRLSDNKIAGFETLIRWFNPKKGLIFPDEFIPAAERTNIVDILDLLMLEKSCELLPKLQEISNTDLFLSVNLSGINFENEHLSDKIGQIINKSGINQSHIRLEITESALINAELALSALSQLKEIGVSIALDDFGTGYSSLGYLHKFPIDVLKIDRSFVSQISTDEKGIDIIRAIANLAHNFRLKVVAEGIETKQDEEIIKKLGCEYGQGYYYSKPVPYEEAVSLLKKSL